MKINAAKKLCTANPSGLPKIFLCNAADFPGSWDRFSQEPRRLSQHDANPRAGSGFAAVIVVIMGVAGSGKTTLGKALATALGWDFQEGDDLHPAANIAKMKAGVPLTDQDRYPWLEKVKAWIDGRLSEPGSAVIACSALKRAYRAYLGLEREGIRVVFINGARGLITERIANRTAHFMPASLLASQFDTLEPPAETETHIFVDAGMTTEAQVALVKKHLS